MSRKKGWTFRFPGVLGGREGAWFCGAKADVQTHHSGGAEGARSRPVGRARYRWRVVKVPAPQSACLDTAQQAGELEVEAS